MTIKMMLNKDEEIKRLAQDPEVQIKIKDAITDAIAKRAVKALDNAEIHKAFNNSLEAALFDDKPSWRPPLKKVVIDRIESAVETAFDERLFEILKDKLPKYEAEFRQILDERLKEIEKLDFTALAKNAVERYIEKKFAADR